MDYSNPDIPEGINYSKTHPLKEFVLLTTGVFGVLLIAVLLLGVFADHFAQYIPYRVEKNFHILVPAKDEALKRIEKIKNANWLLFQQAGEPE